MSLDNKKLKIALLTLFVGAWIFGVGQLGYAHFVNNKSTSQIEQTSIAQASRSSSGSLKDKSLLLTGIIGVFHYIYQK